jgi:hypothetical protein
MTQNLTDFNYFKAKLYSNHRQVEYDRHASPDQDQKDQVIATLPYCNCHKNLCGPTVSLLAQNRPFPH